MKYNYLRVHAWLWQRITAFILFAGLAIHFIVLHYFTERPITFEKVSQRFSHPFWVIFDILLLFFALYHALNGLWNIYIDFNPGKAAKKFSGWLLFFIGIFSFIFGVYILIPFSS